MASVLIRPPLSANSMRPRWVTPRLAPSPITLARTSLARDTDGVVGAIADLASVSSLGPDIGPDPPEPHQVDRRLSGSPFMISLGRGRCPGPGPDSVCIWGESGIDFGWRENTPPPCEINAGVVIRPARAGQIEQTLAFGIAAPSMSGSGSMKMSR